MRELLKMLHLSKKEGPTPKCFFTSSTLPFVNHDQLPSKKKPFSTIASQSFTHTLDIVLPEDGAKSLQQQFDEGSMGKLQYARVYMKLSDVVEGDFFNQYIKTGNILMLSQGRTGIDHIFSLSEGILRLEVDKATYERMGLKGSAIPSEGRKHVKARYAIELNLRLPSMVRGKKGFERVIWAFKNVLNHTITWLFHDFKGAVSDGSGPIAAHQPQIKTVEPQIEDMHSVQVPQFPRDLQQDDYETPTELLEWLSFASMCSPRIQNGDTIDPYLCRYRVPTISTGTGEETPREEDLVRFRWHGFIPSTFIQSLFLATLKASGDGWFAFNAAAFDGKAYTFLQNQQHTMTWEYMD